MLLAGSCVQAVRGGSLFGMLLLLLLLLSVFNKESTLPDDLRVMSDDRVNIGDPFAGTAVLLSSLLAVLMVMDGGSGRGEMAILLPDFDRFTLFAGCCFSSSAALTMELGV